MIYTIITLLVVGIILFIVSFYMNNRFDEIEEQIEQLSISVLQDRYLMKNKIKVLEEELLTNQPEFFTTLSNENEEMKNNSSHRQLSIIERIRDLHSKGFSIEEIEKEIGISKTDIQTIIHNQSDIKLI